jgi:hypothetical protein
LKGLVQEATKRQIFKEKNIFIVGADSAFEYSHPESEEVTHFVWNWNMNYSVQ